jgi:hypothetical protein
MSAVDWIRRTGFAAQAAARRAATARSDGVLISPWWRVGRIWMDGDGM